MYLNQLVVLSMQRTSAERRYLIYLAIVSGTLILGGVVLLTYGVMFL